MADLNTELCGLRMETPFMLASGILGETGTTLKRAMSFPIGALVTKSIGVEPRPGYPNPTVMEVDCGLLNAIGLANPGIDAYMEELAEAVQAAKDFKATPIIGSIFGADEGEFCALAKRMEEGGAAAIELNLGCPHAKGYGAQIGQDPALVKAITKAVKGSVAIPVFVKITPNVTDITTIAAAVEEGRGDAVVAINTLRAMAIDIDARRPILHNRTGGLSGPAVRPVGIAAVWAIHETVDIPVIGVGGISTGRDVMEYLMAGASAVQVGTAVWKGGLEVFDTLRRELECLMGEQGVEAVKDLVGVAHRG